MAASHPLVLLLPLLALLVVVALVFPDRQDDEAGYLELARNVTHGHYVTGRPDALLDADPSYPDLWFGPGLPLALTGPVAADLPLTLIRLVGPLFLFLALIVFYALLRRHLRPTHALVGTWALGVYLPFYTLLPNLHSEPLAILGFVIALYAIARVYEDGSARWIGVGALGLTVLMLTRVDYGWVTTIVLAVLLVWWGVTRTRAVLRLALMCALGLILCTPWLAYTYDKTDRVLQWGNSGSLSLYWMSSPYSGDLGDWQQANDVFTMPELAPHRPFFRTLRGLPLPRQNKELEHQALRNIRDHPGKYLKNVVANVSRMLFDTPYSYTEQRLGAAYFALPNGLLLGILAVAIVVALRARPARLPAPVWPFAIFAVSSFVLHAAVAAYPRMLMPIVPILVWFVAVTIARNVQIRRVAAQESI
jgi:hypothetical protein